MINSFMIFQIFKFFEFDDSLTKILEILWLKFGFNLIKVI